MFPRELGDVLRVPLVMLAAFLFVMVFAILWWVWLPLCLLDECGVFDRARADSERFP